MPQLPPPPPGFVVVGGGTGPGLGRPIIRKGADPVRPDLPEGYAIGPDGTAAPVPGLPSAFTQPGPKQTSAQAEADKIDVELKKFELADKRKKAAENPADGSDAIYQLTNVIDKAKQARRKSNQFLATGFGSSLARKFGGTPAADVQGLLDTIGGNQAFDRLQKMRDSSPTGGALGAISERELDLLKSTVASLSPDQSDEQFQKGMLDIIKSYGRVLMKIPGGREEAIKRGWAVGNGKQAPAPKRPAQQSRVVDFNDLPE